MRRPTASSTEKPQRPPSYGGSSGSIDDLEGGGSASYPPPPPRPFGAQPSPPRSSGSYGSSNTSTGGLYYDGGKKSKRVKSQFGGNGNPLAFLSGVSQNSLYTIGGILAFLTLILAFFGSVASFVLWTVTAACVWGAVVACLLHSTTNANAETPSPELRAVADPIREGASGFLRVQYTTIAQLAVPLAMLIVFSYGFRPDAGFGVSNMTLGLTAAASFGVGATCSALAGYWSMWVAAHCNLQVALASRTSYASALVTCFRGGAFSAVLNLTLCVAGVSLLYMLVQLIHPSPLLLVGYGFGASFVALCMQLGGGIYTKAADVGADLVGKVEQSIPEDDPRNPAVIADLVGDMVGDCVGSSADVFESVAAEMIGAMILASTLGSEAELGTAEASRFVFFPLIVHAMDIVVSSAGIFCVNEGSNPNEDPMQALQRGYRVALGLSAAGFFVITQWLLSVPGQPGVAFKYFLCGVVGMVCAYIIVGSTQYYTDYAFPPVQSIAEASTTGHGTNIIVGVSVGMKSTFIPTITVAIAVLMAYHLGASTGLGSGRNAGLFGTAVATMGMLSNAVYILSMNNFGPIADNAGGITEMSMQPESVRDVTDRLDAAGNVTKAVTKGYSIGSASMACFLLFGAFMDEFSEFSGVPFTSVDIATPEVLVGGLIGSMVIFYFTGLAISAVGRTAHEVVIEVRRQFKENPDIMTYKAKPDYERCVSLVTKAALKEMQFPGLVCVVTPILIGLVFRFVGEFTNRPLLGAEVLASYLMFGTVTGILMALFLDIAGGAWDNAKKYIEDGHHGGKNSEAHKAAVTGDTVGDPFKDTAVSD